MALTKRSVLALFFCSVPPQQQIAATGFFPFILLGRQSRKATFFIAFDCPSVFIKTRCQLGSVIVA